MNTGRASNTGRGSDIIVLTAAGGFYSRKYGNQEKSPTASFLDPPTDFYEKGQHVTNDSSLKLIAITMLLMTQTDCSWLIATTATTLSNWFQQNWRSGSALVLTNKVNLR